MCSILPTLTECPLNRPSRKSGTSGSAATTTTPVHPGLVISWQYSPVHKVTDSSWTALVLVSPFDGAVLVEWVNADRLSPVSDSTPADGP